LKFFFGSSTEKIQYYIQLEAHFVFWILLIAAFIFYRLFLKSISSKRHKNLKHRFTITAAILILSALFSSTYWFFSERVSDPTLIKFANILALISLILVSITAIRLAQIYVYLYLFSVNMSQGIPRLIVNLFTVISSIAVACYLASEVFAINLTAMLATSAVFSLVLGLALQDTLGNLFSGVAIQMGQPFKLGDWVEISVDSKKWTGQIQEITWRATFISSFSDEWIMIPNKTIAQSEIIIFSNNNKILRQSQTFRIDYGADIDLVKTTIYDAIQNISDLLKDPEPRVLMTETGESWITLKIFYSTKDFSIRYRTEDQVIQNVLRAFKQKNLKFASAKMHLEIGNIEPQSTSL
jgi:small-conductance mechanosensitive channel